MSTNLKPMIVAGKTDIGTIYAQVWHPSYSPVGPKWAKPACVASVTREGDEIRFNILPSCPAEWHDHAVGIFTLVRRGMPVPATHTISWAHFEPEFTALVAEPPADAPATLDGLEVEA